MNNEAQLPTISTFHEVKKLLTWEEGLKTFHGLALLKRS